MAVLNSDFTQGVGNLPIKKMPRGFAQEGWPGLELTDR